LNEQNLKNKMLEIECECGENVHTKNVHVDKEVGNTIETNAIIFDVYKNAQKERGAKN
jgi:hypothetical protein